jgi:copper chaperone CopZ
MAPDVASSERTYAVQGMSCQHCVHAVTGEVSAVAGVAGVAVDLAAGLVTVTGVAIDDSAVRAAIGEAGYAVAS